LAADLEAHRPATEPAILHHFDFRRR
jgi:hypothetical protein